jgi:aryl-alcohol dehydrogenase-like predicted oxidoreductase
MERVALAGTDLCISRICYGTAGLGTAVTGSDVGRLINTFRDEGGNFLDTAHVYGAWALNGTGASERAIGDYVRRNGPGDLVVATKGGHPPMDGYRRTDCWLAPYRIRADVDDSLGRLGVDAIDLYYLHRDDTRTGVGEVIETLNEEVQCGRIRHLGASNWTWQRLEAANNYAEENDLQGFVVSQVEWSLAHKDSPSPQPHGTQTVYVHEEEVAFHERTGLALAAYTATARGYFAPGTEKREDFDNPLSRERRRRAEQLAEEMGLTANQVALAWLMNQSFPVFPITGTQSVQHLRENLGAAHVELSPEQVAWLAGGRP